MQEPKVVSYNFVSTPTITPGVDASPLMTWGSVEGSPLLLEPLDTPIAINSVGPTFQIAHDSEREKVARELSDKSAAKVRQRVLQHTPKRKLNEVSASPVRKGDLSPAVRELLHKSMPKKTAIDTQLRASYSPAVHKNKSSTTPATPKISTPGTPNSSSTPIIQSSITDNLLKLPKKS